MSDSAVIAALSHTRTRLAALAVTGSNIDDYHAALTAIAALLAALPEPGVSIKPATEPIDATLDPVAFRDQFHTYGLVVADRVVPNEVCAYTTERIATMVSGMSLTPHDLSPRFSLADPATWDAPSPHDADGTPLLHRAFLELFHDDGLAQLRQSPALWFAYALIWGTPHLSVSFDRLAVKLPGRLATDTLPLHVDQNPNRCSELEGLQGLVALVDNPVELGCFAAIPASRDRFDVWATAGVGLGDYVPLATAPSAMNRDPLWDEVVAFPLTAGQGVFWDSRTAHTSLAPDPALVATAADHVATGVRLVALVAMAPSVTDQAACVARREAFTSGGGANIRDARMHASYRPRFDDPAIAATVRVAERLTALGAVLYFGTNQP